MIQKYAKNCKNIVNALTNKWKTFCISSQNSKLYTQITQKKEKKKIKGIKKLLEVLLWMEEDEETVESPKKVQTFKESLWYLYRNVG